MIARLLEQGLQIGQKLLTHPRFPLLAALYAFIFALPTIHLGWYIDDLFHQIGYSHSPTINHYFPSEYRLAGPMRMYSFFNGGPEIMQWFKDRGFYPWWTPEEMHIALWRPIAGWIASLEYRFWPEKAPWMHIQSIGWFALLAYFVAHYYRTMMGKSWLVGVATILFLMNGCLSLPVAWLANRHTLLALVFGILTLIAHDRWRKSEKSLWAFLSSLYLLLSVLSSESGIATVAYLLSYAVFIDTTPKKSRFLSCLPYLVIILGWRMVYNHLGYGAWGNAWYIDPVREPLRFAWASIERLPILLFGVFGYPNPEFVILLSPQATRIYSLCTALILGIGIYLLYPLGKQDRMAGFWAWSSLLSAIPFCAGIPDQRNMSFTTFGAIALFIVLIQNWREPRSSLPTHRGWLRFVRVWVWISCIIFGIINPLNTLGRPQLMSRAGKMFSSQLKIGNYESLAGKDIVLVNPILSPLSAYVITNQLLHDQIPPSYFRTLASGIDPLEIERVDEYTLRIHPQQGYYPPAGPLPGRKDNWKYHIHFANLIWNCEHLIRSNIQPALLGQTISLTGLTITISKITPDKRIGEATFRFAVPLEDPSLHWIYWNAKTWKYERFILPDIGTTMTLPS